MRALAALLALAPAVASAGDFIDTTVTFVASDDNVLAGLGETLQPSPRFDFRPRRGNALFFENYNRRDTGEETRTQLVLYKAFDGYFEGVSPEAAMVLEWDANRNARTIERYAETTNRATVGGIRDKGSYLGVNWQFDEKQRLSLVLFPFDSDRMRIGYSWELSWGGNESFILARRVPGARLSYQWDGGYAFVGGKTGRAHTFTLEEDDPQRDEEEPLYAALAGAGLFFGPHLSVEAAGGWFKKGTIPIDRGELQGTPIHLYGASAQVTWSDGIAPQTPIDTKLLRNTGAGRVGPRYKAGSAGWLVSVEGAVVSQVLEDYENVGTSTRDSGFAGDVNFQARDGAWSFNGDLVMRSLEFLVQGTPGLFPFSTTPESLDTTPELFAAVGADYYIQSLRLQPGVTLGVQLPASVRGRGLDPEGREIEIQSVVRKSKDVTGDSTLDQYPLPSGEEVLPVFSSQFTLRSDISDLITLVAEVQLTMDRNLVANNPDEGKRAFENPYILGVGLLAQARF